MIDKYEQEAKKRFENTKQYQEYLDKSKYNDKEIKENLGKEMDSIILEFSICKKNNVEPSSDLAQNLVAKLQKYISKNYYDCNNEILKYLGLMYVQDKRFSDYLDRFLIGTAKYIKDSIDFFYEKC